MAVPTVKEIRDYLECYGIDASATYALTGTVNSTSAIITAISTINLKKYMEISGAGIPAGATILSVDSGTQITISALATISGTGVAITITYNSILSDEWIFNRMTNIVIPFIERKCGVTVSGERQFVEVYSGTGQPQLILNRRNIKQIDKIEILTGTINTQLIVSSLEVLSAEGIIRAKAYVSWGTIAPYFPKGASNIKVTYTCSDPTDLKEAIVLLTCEAILGVISGRTGGGSAITADGYSRSWGDRSKYTEIRNDMSRQALELMRKYMSGVTGA